MQKVLITGGHGMLGRTLEQVLTDANYEVIITDHHNGDITNLNNFDSVLKRHKPDCVIHCAAMTAVDNCESEVDHAYLLNAVGTQNVARACNTNNIRLIAISTDYVFDGKKETPYNEYDIAGNCDSIYGKSKYAAEVAVKTFCKNHVIVRVSWLYGGGGPSFVHTMMRLGVNPEIPNLKVVNDQFGNPTSTEAVANKLLEILSRRDLTGIIHATCEGEANWYDFAKEIFKIKNIEKNVIPCTTDEFPTPATRPKNSRLDKMNLRLYHLKPMPQWQDALKTFLDKEQF